jgi:hypothetical protein
MGYVQFRARDSPERPSGRSERHRSHRQISKLPRLRLFRQEYQGFFSTFSLQVIDLKNSYVCI